MELGQVVGKAGFLVESALESMTVYAGENQVSVQADAGFTGVKRSGRNLNAGSGAGRHPLNRHQAQRPQPDSFRATVNEKYIP
jgi:hypothetical protein